MMEMRNPDAGNVGAPESSWRADHPKSSLTPAWVFDPDERELHDAEVKVRAAGYALAVQCLDCGSWLVSARSVAAHRGPVCRGRRSAGAQ